MIRIGGAQIPVGTDIQANKKEIFKAIDWAKEHEVNHLLTPECALSGWLPGWEQEEKFVELTDALKEVEDHQKEANVGLALGTHFKEPEPRGLIHRNEIRHYDSAGNIQGMTYKTCTIAAQENVQWRDAKFDPVCVVDLMPPEVEDDDLHLLAGSLICNDLWGYGGSEIKSIAQKYFDMGVVQVLFHATNGSSWDKDRHMDNFQWEVFDKWHNAHLQMTSLSLGMTILTADACTDWDWDGNEEQVDKAITSSESGVLVNGKWKTEVPRKGRQYFKYDIEE